MNVHEATNENTQEESGQFVESLWVVCVLLSKHNADHVLQTQTISWRRDVSEDEAKGAAVAYALQTRPGYSVEMITAVDISQPVEHA